LELTASQRELLYSVRRAVLATIRSNGRPRLVPCVFSAAGIGDQVVLYTPLDEKPKSLDDPRQLGRVRDILARPQVSLLVDRWSEDWTELGWLRLDGRASLLEPGASEHHAAARLLRDRYAQYGQHGLEGRPIIRVEVESVSGWSASAAP
jgi:PPOX class probable F420-dependent enzyme